MRIFQKLQGFFKGPSLPAMPAPNYKTEEGAELALHSEIAGLKLSIGELKQELNNRQALLQQVESSHREKLNQLLEAKLSNLFGGLAAPLAQLALLQSLASEGKELKTENIFKLVTMIIDTLSENGMLQLHEVNAVLPYDGAGMAPIKPELTFTPGEKIRVCLPGYSFNDKYLCKSLVHKV
jgi:hypothetical protein